LSFRDLSGAKKITPPCFDNTLDGKESHDFLCFLKTHAVKNDLIEVS